MLDAHDNLVYGCAASPHSSVIASASLDTTVKLWNTDSGECIKVLRGHNFSVNSCNFTPDGLNIISGSCDK